MSQKNHEGKLMWVASYTNPDTGTLMWTHPRVERADAVAQLKQLSYLIKEVVLMQVKIAKVELITFKKKVKK